MPKENIIIISCSIVYMDARVKSYIRALADKGYHVDVISLKEKKSDKFRVSENNFVNYRVATRYIGGSVLNYFVYYFLFSIKAFLLVSCLSITRKVRVVHYNNLPNFPIFAAIVPKLLGAMMILDNHDLITAVFFSKFANDSKNWIVNSILLSEQNISMWFADRIITADHYQKDFLINVGIPSKKITVILNLANEKLFKPNNVQRTDQEFKLVYHGTISERLGIDIAIEAVNISKDRIANLKFHLIGKGDFLDHCAQLVDYYAITENIFLSKCFYPVEQLSDIISKMDVGVIPNRKTQATDKYMLPVKLLEYVYMQKPVIAPRLKIIERYFDETMIKYFEPENVEDLARCIVELYENPEERKSLVNKANKFIKKYNWKTQEKEYLKLILSGKHTN